MNIKRYLFGLGAYLLMIVLYAVLEFAFTGKPNIALEDRIFAMLVGLLVAISVEDK